MTDHLITSGSLLDQDQAPVRTTLVAGAIREYLERHDKVMNEAILAEMCKSFEKSITRQIMSPRMNRTGYESTTSYTSPCARKARLQYDGVAGEPVQARALLKFILGDMVELTVIGIAQLAGVQWTDNNRSLFITGKDGVGVNVHPDGRIITGSQVGATDVFLEKQYNGEIKSCDSRTYDRWLDQGGPDDTWGYLTQCSIEIQAWREAGYDINSTCFVACSTGTRQGSVAEWILPFDQSLVDQWHERRALARGKDMPKVPFEAEPEMRFEKGKAIYAEWLAAGATPRLNVNGAIHGWDVPTGRKVLPMLCSYCAYKGQCWTEAQMEEKGGRPVWVSVAINRRAK